MVKQRHPWLDEWLNQGAGLEISTMIVSQISLEPFNPPLVYQQIYALSVDSLLYGGVEPSVKERLLCLRSTLTSEYQRLWPKETDLPAPDNQSVCRKLWQNQDFTRCLFELGAEYSYLSSCEAWCGQTRLELNGQITNFFQHSLFNRNHYPLLLQLHQLSITMAVRQWQSLLNSMLKTRQP